MIFENDIEINCVTNRFKVKAGSDFMKGKYFNSLGTRLVVRNRDRKAPGKFLSSPLSAVSMHRLDEDFYYDDKEQPFNIRKPVDGRDKSYDADNFGENGLTVFYFDKNRGRHLSHGTYRTTFDTICDDLNWRFRKKLSFESKVKDYERRITAEGFDWVLEMAQAGTGAKLAEEFAKFFDETMYENLRFDLFDPLEPFSSSSLSVREPGTITGVTPKKLGSGVELILALLLQKLLSDQVKTQRIYLIDEPELHLHPRAQEKLALLLLEEAKNSQVVIFSHSPYLHLKLRPYSQINTFRSVSGKKEVKSVNKGKGLFPWSPSFGEVNYLAFGMVTIDFFNEVYGFFMEKNSLSRAEEVDNLLVKKGEKKDKKWVKAPAGSILDVTLATYVRHSIHHPENSLNHAVGDVELQTATETLIRLL